MNKKNEQEVKGNIINVRLTDLENEMAKTLRLKYSVNVSSLVRKSIREEYEKILSRN